MIKLNGIQIFLQQNDNYAGLNKLEQKLQVELNTILNKEELIWFQRLRAKWLVDDHNAKYNHFKSVKKRKNKIVMQNNNGQWIEENK